MYTYDNVKEYIMQEDIGFVRLMFTDKHGNGKFITILADELDRAFKNGISFDGSAVDGFGSEEKSDFFLIPDPNTMALVPWHSVHGKMVRFYCDVVDENGVSVPSDSRSYLKKAVQDAKDMGIELSVGTEFEFYIFKNDENGNRTDIPFDNAGYMDIDPGDKCETLRREICYALKDMGIEPECAHHEEGPGQNEIDFRPSDPLKAADNATTFKSVVRTIAIRNGLYANFKPKPLEGKAGNGLHVNISLNKKELQDNFMAGVLAHIEEITYYLNASEESYKRLGRCKAPSYISWAKQNRTQLIRVPLAHEGRERFELRSPDASMNPYIGFALIIYAGLDGVKNKMIPMEPINENLYDSDKTVNLKRLPSSLKEAKMISENSAWIKEIMPKKVR